MEAQIKRLDDAALMVVNALDMQRTRHPLLGEQIEEIESAVSMSRIRLKLRTGETFVIDITRESKPRSNYGSLREAGKLPTETVRKVLIDSGLKPQTLTLDVHRGARRRNHRCHHRALPATWNGAHVVRDGARSGVGRHDRADRRVGLHEPDLAVGHLDPEWVLRRAVSRIDLAVSVCCAGATSRGRRAGNTPVGVKEFLA